MTTPPAGAAKPELQKNLVERILAPLADVRAGEGVPVLLMAVNLFLVLGAYYMLKTIREALILAQGGAEVKTYSSAGQALLLLILVPAFAALASRVNRIQLVRGLVLFFVSNLAVFFVLGRAGVKLGVPFFLWVGIFNVMVIAQFWAFANDIFTPEQGKRVFAIVGLGSNVGAWVGAILAGRLIKAIGPYGLVVIAAVVLSACLLITQYLHHRQGRTQRTAEGLEDAEKPLGGTNGAFGLIAKSRYLMLIAGLIVVLNIVNTSGEFILGKYVVKESVQQFGAGPESEDARERYIGAFYGDYFSWANIASFATQMFLVSRLFRFLGVGGALFIHPAVALFGWAFMTRVPSLPFVRVLKIADNSIDYSLGNTAKQALWLPTSREEKYKAKQAVDAFFMRTGDVLQAGIVYVGTQMAMTVPGFAMLNVGLAIAWLVIVGFLGPENRRRMAAAGAGS
jgi:ATP:ADP antiporter, AAA family